MRWKGEYLTGNQLFVYMFQRIKALFKHFSANLLQVYSQFHINGCAPLRLIWN